MPAVHLSTTSHSPPPKHDNSLYPRVKQPLDSKTKSFKTSQSQQKYHHQKANKGSIIVVQDRKTYIGEGLKHLSDEKTYKLKGDAITKLVKSPPS